MPSSKEKGKGDNSLNAAKAEELKQQGNESVKLANYSAAVIHYTHAISLDPRNHFLYSNRSHAFLKLDQYYLALQDAKDTIRLQPTWPKGFYRKGEVEFKVQHYTSALISFGQAMMLDSSNEEVKEAITKTNKEIIKLRKAAGRQPWIFCGCGAVLGLLIVLADQFLAKQPSIQYVVLQLILILVFTGLGYLLLYIYKYINSSQTRSLLEPPVDLLDEMGVNKDKKENVTDKEISSQNDPRSHRKGGASAGRQRYKKGKT